MATLPTNYQDDILASSMDGKRHYTMQTDTGGTTFTDISEYDQRGSAFGAAQINETNTQVNTNTGQIANKLNSNGDGQNVTVTYTSNDVSSDASATAWTVISKFTSGETLKSLFGKVSTLCKNVRYLYNNKRSKSESFNSTSDTVSFTTADVANDAAATSWTADVSQLTSGLTHANLLNRISAMMKNTRYLNNSTVKYKVCYMQWSGADIPSDYQRCEYERGCVWLPVPLYKYYMSSSGWRSMTFNGDPNHNSSFIIASDPFSFQVLVTKGGYDPYSPSSWASNCLFIKPVLNSGATAPNETNCVWICYPYITSIP